MENALISPDRHWMLWAIVLGAAAFGLWAERTRIGSRLSGAVVAIGTTFVLSNLGIIPVSAPVYDTVWAWFVPLAIPLLLFDADLRRILRETGPTLLAFVAGAMGTVLGTWIAFRIVPLGVEGWRLAGIFCATYVGGSMNYVAAAETLELRSGELLTAGIAADNLVMTLYFLVLFALPSIPRLRAAFVQRHLESEATHRSPAPSDSSSAPTVRETATGLALSAAFCAAGYGAATAVGESSAAILIVTALVVAAATLFPGSLGKLRGARQSGTLLMQVFFAVIGASANIGVVVREGAVLFVFAALILTVHLAVLLTAGKLLRLDLAEIVVASNANMGGPTTAAAMATARGWDALVTPAILCGTLGYAVGTFVGTGVGRLLAP